MSGEQGLTETDICPDLSGLLHLALGTSTAREPSGGRGRRHTGTLVTSFSELSADLKGSR